MFDNLNIINNIPIYPEISGGYLRTYNIARLASCNFKNTTIFAVDENIDYSGISDGVNLHQSKKYNNSIEKLKYYCEGLFSKNFSLKASLKAFEAEKDTLFQIEGPYFYNLLLKNDIDNYILDEHNVYWELSDFPATTFKDTIYKKFSYKRDKEIEIKSLKNAAHILVCSNKDKSKIVESIPEVESKISIIPNCVNLSEYELCRQNNESLPHDDIRVLFMGLLSYSPNRDAVNLICHTIAPECSKYAKFIIIGKNPPKVQHPNNVEFLGYVDDIKKHVLQSDICICPLRYGSGTRFKILEYMAMGKTVISTSKGAEGINYTNNKNIIIEDNIYAYPRIINQLIENETKRESIGREAIKLIQKEYNWDNYQATLHRIYTSI